MTTRLVLKDGKGKHYNDIMHRVQKTLRKVLGVEIVPLRVKEGVAAKSASSLPQTTRRKSHPAFPDA